MTTQSVSSFWKHTIPSSAAAGWVGAAVLASAAGIELARAWTQRPAAGGDAAQVVGGFLVAIFVLGAFVLATRTRDLATAAVISIFGVLAHGGTLVLDGHVVGAMFMGMGPVLALLTHVTFRPDPEPRDAGGDEVEVEVEVEVDGAAEEPPYRPTPVTFIRASVQNA
jgi:hypothetical protein